MDSRKVQNILLLAIVVLLAMIVFKDAAERNNQFFSVASANAQIGKTYAVPSEQSPIPMEWGELVTSYIHNGTLFFIFQNSKKEIWVYRAAKFANQEMTGNQPAELAEVSVFSRK